ncbi:MAG: pantoate--beta-alanine ligase [Gemmatirosa sp.]
MLTIGAVDELRAELRRLRDDARVLGGGRVAFVPTMGFLHDGHLTLVDEARRRADVVAMSIFVNPLQFAPTEDLARYPRDPDGDAAKAAARGVDLLFTPSVTEMYPREPRVHVVPGELAGRWEGEVRPGHFAGVLTVVAKLLHLVAPDVVIFGQKDVQQATLVRAMVRDLDMPVELVIAPTVREADGLALSSRNVYLDADQRRRARVIPRALARIEAGFARGERRADALLTSARDALSAEPSVTPDYLALVDHDTLEPVDVVQDGSVAMIAARVGRTRLLDNAILGRSPRVPVSDDA